ncbi:MAG: PBP1A family penicillin-binding protein, partial [Pseudomonadota bacterium]
LWLSFFVAIIVVYYAIDLPKLDLINKEFPRKSISITAKNKQNNEEITLTKYGNMYGDYIEFHQLPQNLINAVIATEDRRYFQHQGVDYIGILRAAFNNIVSKKIVEGGSTITQQLAKNIYLSSERSFKRKIQEILLSIWLERKYSKEDIFAFYLNKVYFGSGNYGVDSAARFYFDKPVTEVNLYEAAMLAGLLKAPSKYSPTSNPKLAENRTNQILINMKNAGYIDLEDIQNIDNNIFLNQHGRGILKNRYFTDWVINNINRYNVNFKDSNNNIKIITTLDPALQNIAETLLKKYIDNYGEKYNFSQGAMIAMSAEGEILAMVGGYDYSVSQFNRATNAYRSPGSLFKIFVYIAAFEFGKKPTDIYLDQPIKIKNWIPQNYNDKDYGEITLAKSLIHSVNRIAISLTQEIGIKNVINIAKDLGITSDINHDLTSILGSSSVSLLEIVHAYAHLANHGNKVNIRAVNYIYDDNDNIQYAYNKKDNNYANSNIISSHVIANMNNILHQVITIGTGKKANFSGQYFAGKTGTSQDFRDAWFVGYNSDIVVGIWLGNDDNSPTNKLTGGFIPAMLWGDFMQIAILDESYQKELPKTARQVERYRNKEKESLLERFLRFF